MSEPKGPLDNLSPGELDLALQRLLARKQQKARPPAAFSEPIPRRADGGLPPASFGQQRLWFLDRLEPGSAAYNLPTAALLTGRLDVAALSASLREIVRRHESLRTAFEMVDGEPRQRIAPPGEVSLPLLDLAALPEEEGRREADRLVRELSATRFDLARGPLFTAALMRFAVTRHLFLVVMHHVITDGWSVGVLVRELAALYEAALERRPSRLPELPVQYADFAVWQSRALATVWDRQLAYWTDRLGGEIVPLELPTDRPRPAVRAYRGGRRRHLLAKSLADRIHSFGRSSEATLFMVLVAAAKVLLHRLSGQDDILVGTPVAGRRQVETEGLIGFFLNTLVLRTDVRGDSGFRALVRRIREVTLDAYSHQDIPFEALLARLGGERDLSRTPFFQVFFNLVNLPPREVRLPGLDLEMVSSPEVASKFDLTFYASESADGIYLSLVYNADLFDDARISLMMEQLEAVLVQAVESPEEPIASLSLVTAASRTLLPDPAAELDSGWVGAVHALFAARAAAAPGRVAIVEGEGTWSYGELAEAAHRLARWLREQGVGPGDRVAIHAHRSAPLVQAVLGVLASGAAFVLLDPAYPAARLVEILGLAAPAAWIELEAAGAPAPEVERWLAASGCPRLVLPRGGSGAALARLAAFAGEPPYVEIGPDDVAVVTFTSGSSGRPKGVLGRHGPLSHFLPWQCACFGLRTEDRFSLLSGLAHDPLQRDIFTPLYLGATIVIPAPEEIGVAGRLAEWMARSEVTVAHLTPAMGQLLTEPQAGGAVVEVPRLRLVLLVGDALTRLDVARIRRLAPGVTCVNLYGSTETQRAVGYHVAEPDGRGHQVLPLGKGMEDVQLLVLNRAGRLAGVGELGEIAVRSPHLALGYLGDAELTAEKFRINPFTGSPGDRIYRTGDLGRYLPDGEVVFAGRADLQIKIRGFRIEPAEIEASLAALPGVREAIVLAREQRGEKRLVAYVVPEREGAIAAAGLGAALRERLPVHMVPSDFVLLPRLPLNPNGKVDRRTLAAIAPDETRRGGAPLQGELERRIAVVWREVLGVEEVGADDNFFDVGGHSLLLVRLHSRLEEALGRTIPLVELFGAPTVRSQAEHLARGTEPVRSRPRARRDVDGRIAIIGMAGRFPKAPDLERFWQGLRDGFDGISRFSDEELAAAGVRDERVRHPRSVRARGVLEDVDLFDAAFFDYSPLQAEMMDPQLRLFLECAWQALEGAGHDPERYPGAIGVYAGAGLSTYFLRNLAGRPDLLETMGGYQAAIAVDRDYLTTQVSYKLGLRGPSLDVQTACSTSLVAVHLACQALLGGECDMSIAGGVTVKVPQVTAYASEEGGIDSLSGRCRAFDAGADGTVWGSGVGLVVLKRLEDALADGDTIHAVILGSAINNDGALKVGYTAPSIAGQAEVIAAALDRAGVSPDTITCVEAHGTGTPLGDPIEVAALTRAFRPGTGRTGYCALGSVKTNVGHLGTAAGIAGLIKTVLALKHRQIPPSLGFETPNPGIDFAASPFYVNTELVEWRSAGTPRRAGVSSFGLGGTNAHVILEEAPEAAPSGPSRPWQLLPLSARSAAALDTAMETLAGWLGDHPEADLTDVARTLQIGRRAFAWRRFLVCRDAGEARRALAARDPQHVVTARCDVARRPVAFLFPGQGTQHVGMGWGLYRGEPVFRREVDACAELLRPLLGRDLRDVLDPLPEQRDEMERELLRTRLAQPALFVIEYALARLWMSWGLSPWAMIGHSLGEYVAACLAGVFSLADALALVAARGALMDELQPGAMLSVELGEEELAPLLGPGLDLAAVNGPSLCVASGPKEAVAALEARLAERGVGSRRLHTSHAFHSAMMDPILARFERRVAQVELRPPTIPFLSNLTGAWIEPAEATDPEYWVRHLRRTVRFGEGIEHLLARAPEGGAALLEVGPGRALGSLARQVRPESPVAVASMRHPRDQGDDEAVLLRALGRLWLAGVAVDWEALHTGTKRRRVPLPTYPFERRRFWIESDRAARPASPPSAGRPIELPPELLETLRRLAGPDATGFCLTVLPAVEGGATVTLAPAGPAAQPGLGPGVGPEPEDLAARIAGLFGRLLGVESVGAWDDFFELGGHSLLGTRLISRLRDELGVELPIDALFEAPTPAALAREIERTRRITTAGPPLRPVPRTSELPLSFTQERLWFLEQLHPGNAAYHMPSRAHLAGPLDVAALRCALDGVVGRHEILRTTFAFAGDRPVQVIAPPQPAALLVVDLAGLPVASARREAERLLAAEAVHPFDLTRGPLFRTLLIEQEAEERVLAMNLHHIVSDGWSTQLLIREMAALYGAAVAGRAPSLPELPVQYADYGYWQRRWLQGAELERQLSYWRERLGGELQVLDLPTDRPRPLVQSFRDARCGRRLTASLAAELRTLGRHAGATLFMTLLAGFEVLFHRWSGLDDLLVGTPVAGRTRSEVEDLIGPFINTVVLRTDLSGSPTFMDLLGRVRDSALGAFAHQDVPFEHLLQELHPDRDPARTPLFQVLFNMLNMAAASPEAEPLELPGLRASFLPAAAIGSKFDLTVYAAEPGDEIRLELVYNPDLFDAGRMEALLDQIEGLLAEAAARPDVLIGEVSLVPAAHRAFLPDAAEPLDEPAFAPVSRLFLDMAERLPEQPAVRRGTRVWSYAELAARALGVAAALRDRGVTPGTAVGVLGPREPELVAGLLGVILAGGVLLLLDRKLPEQRLRLMLGEAGARALVRVGGDEPETAWTGDLETIDVLILPIPLDAPPAPPRLGPAPAGDDPAYIFFTSGTTGTPKGVLGRQRGLSHFVTWQRETFGIGPGDRVAQLTGLSFDVVLRDLFLPLTSGATLCLPEEDDLTPESVLPWLAESGVTVLHTVPSLAGFWLGRMPAGLRLNRLRWAFFAGEPLQGELVESWRRSFAGGVVNLYGPTETTLAKCFHLVAEPPAPGIQPIGRPLPQTQALVLSAAGHLCGIGEPGEIVLRTPFRSLGYVNAGAEDRGRFRRNPFRENAGDLLYFTGDRGRYRPDGLLEILGRTDDQVKVRGMRVEPAEIQRALARCSGVGEIAVVAREDGAGGKRLIAYVVARAGAALDMAALRRQLELELPDYMVPGAFVPLAELPLTANGKLDRRALPDPGQPAAPMSEEPEAARTPMEELLAPIWAEVLHLGRVGAQDDFFALGGHSLLAMQLCSRVRAAFQIDLPLREVFESRTVAGLAATIERALGAGERTALPPIRRVARDGELPLSFAQQRLWFLHQMEPESAASNLSRAMRFEGPLNAAALAATLTEIVRRHESLRTAFPVVDGRPLQVIAPGGPFPLPQVDLSGLPASSRQGEVRRLVVDEARRPFELAAGPLLRATLLVIGREDHGVLFTMHHIVSDAWSMGVLLRELRTLYAAFAVGRPSHLPELEIQYADFAHWQRSWLEGEAIAAEMSYWRRQLAGLASLELPTDRPRPAVQTFAGGRGILRLGGALADGLRALSRERGATVYMILVAAFQALLQRYSGQEDLAVGTPVAGRGHLQTEPLIGFFVNMLVLRSRLAGDPSFTELLARVRTSTLEAYAHANLPFEKLVDELQPERSLSHTPLFQAVFQLQNAPLESYGLPGLRLSPLDREGASAMYDLRLAALEAADGLGGFLEYRTDLFDAPTIVRWIAHLENLLAGAVAAPDTRLSELPLLAAAELAQVVREWNDTLVATTPGRLLHELFEEQTARRPDAPAVVSPGGETLTYHELDGRANRLAQQLRRGGVGRGDRVAILLDRSASMVVAVLGILKAGAAYVPLDTRSPQARLQWILKTMQVPAIVVGRSRATIAGALATALPGLRQSICLEPVEETPSMPDGCRFVDARALERLPDRRPAREGADEGDLAYVIFTSGSTGTPKGVMVTHAPAVRLVDWVNRTFGMRASDRVLFITSLGFDLSVYDIFGLLAVGGSIRVATDADLGDPEMLAAILAAEPITFWDSAPAALQQLVPFLPPAPGGSLRLVFLSGDWIPLPLPDQVRASFPAAEVVALGGATEATVWSNVFRVGDVSPAWKSIPYGRPIDNARYYVLDRALHPCPVGVPGDLHIGGECLSSGYAAEPALTAGKYLPDPFVERPGAVMYRTGDRARFFADGTIEFLGRLDHQVKLRGFRIELGEIESVLAQHPSVREALALVREDRPGDRRLVAYVTAREEPGLSVEELRSFLQKRLPEYMVPSAVVPLAVLPLTSNGKVDRKALPVPEWQAERMAGFVAPRTPAERVIAEAWAQVLGLEQVGVEDNFFSLGGDSILSIQVISRVARAGLRLTPRQIFELPTVAGLAAVGSWMQEPGLGTESVAVAGPVPLTPIQHWFFERRLPDPHHFNQAVLLELVDGIDPALLRPALELLVEHHEALRARFVPPDGPGRGWRQIAGQPAPDPSFVQIDVVGLSAERQGEALRALAASIQASLDLEDGRLLRAACILRGEGRPGLFLLVIHHLAVDGVSWRILLADLEAVVWQLARGQEPALPPGTTSFRRWAERLAESVRTGMAEPSGWWLAQLRELPPPLPVDLEAGADSEGTTERFLVALEPDATRALLHEAPRAYRTQISDLLLTALARTFAEWTGSGRLLVDLEGHGREALFDDVDLSRTVGWFTSIYPVLLDIEEDATPGESLKRVKEQLRAVPGNGIGHGLLRYLGAGEAAELLRQAPQAGVLFNYLGQLDRVLEKGRLFEPAQLPAGPLRSPRQPRSHRLEINCSISGGRLRASWSYSRNRYRPATIEALAQGFLAALRSLVTHCLSPEAGGYTPADFPLAALDQATLDELLPTRGIEDVYPASPMQQGMLFHTLEAEPGVYIEVVGLLLRGLDVAAFQRVWSDVVERHTALRTSFVWRDAAPPLQVVHERVELPWSCQDWRGISPSEQRERISAHLEAERHQDFDVTAAPLMRFALMRLDDERTWFVWSHHHALLDGWSRPILLREVFVLYSAAVRGERAELAPARPYRDYIAWLESRDTATAERFWRTLLAGFTSPTSIDWGRISAGTPSVAREHGQVRTLLPRDLAEAMRAFARRHQLTLNTLVQGVWALLLGRYSGEEDVVFGAVTSGRSAPVAGIDSMVGLFINTLPARVRISGGEKRLEWLRALQEQQAEARELEHTPLFQVQAWSEVPRGRLFDTILVFENYPVDRSVRAEAGRTLGIGEVRTLERTNFPLTLAVMPGETGLDLHVAHDGRIDGPAATRLPRHLAALLRDLIASPHQDLAGLVLLSPEERHQMLVEWNDSGREVGTPCWHELFERQAERRPDAVALVYGDEHLSYRALDERAGRLAGELRRRGVGPEVRVALCLDRSPLLPMAILAVFKAGGAYVPLDPSYPGARLSTILEDGLASCHPRLLLADGMGASATGSGVAGVEVVRLDRLPVNGTAATEGGDPPAFGAAPDHLAYSIFTSGSTGRPKGVAVAHRGLASLVSTQERMFEPGPGDRVLQFSSPGFDASVWELSVSLCTGATLVLASREEMLPGPNLLHLLREAEITVVTLTPSSLAVMTHEDLPVLSTLVVGGEACPTPLVRTWGRGRRLLNGYGPTEGTVGVSMDVYGGEPLLLAGRPMDNASLYVLDARMEPVPVGVAGELYIAGPGVARGYLDRPDLTAASFIPHPWSGSPGARLYRTGDAARWTADGRIELSGRRDHQVKLRGFRIELGEVENALREHPSVREAVVLIREGDEGEKFLAAYVVLQEAIPAAALKEFLGGRLPGYMVPSLLFVLPELPLLPSEKPDRGALARLPITEAATGATGQAIARTPDEELLAAIFADVLGRERVGPDQDFFELGGHSLLAVRVVSRARAALGVELPVQSIFEEPTAAGLAARLGRERRLAEPAIVPGPRNGELPLSFAQQRLWLVEQLEPGGSAYNVPGAVRLAGRLDPAVLRAALGEIVRRHEALRTTFRQGSNGPVQVIAPTAPPELPAIDLRSLPAGRREAEAWRLALAETLRPFDLGRGPLLRLALIRLGEEDHLLAATMHHIVSDGWSVGILIEELGALYRAFTAGRPSPLPDLPIQYADFATWQRHWLADGVMDRLLAYWTNRLAGAPRLLELRGMQPRPAAPNRRGAECVRLIPGPVARDLQALSRREATTTFMVLLAAFKAVLHARTGSTDIVVGTDVANRSRSETERLIGFFINQLVLRTDLSGNPSFRSLLGRVREACLEAYAHQDLPFDRLVEALLSHRDLRAAPLFQVKLVLQNLPERHLDLPGLQARRFKLETGTSQLDMNLRAVESPDGLFLSMQYNTDLYEAATMERLLEQLENLLQAALARPEARLDELAAGLSRAETSIRAEQDREVRQAGRERLQQLKRRPAVGQLS